MDDADRDLDDYSYESLLDALRRVDRERFPARAAALESELAKRRAIMLGEKEEQQSEQPNHTVEDRAPWFRRTIALLIDLLVFRSFWNFVIGLIKVPIHPAVLVLAHGLLFVVYMVSFYDVSTGKASPGKRIMRLVLRGTAGNPATRAQVAGRSAILSALIMVRWNELFTAAAPHAIPLIAGSLAMGTVIGILLWSIILAVRDPHRRSFHDLVCGTRAVHIRFVPAPSPKGPESITRRTDSVRYRPVVLLLCWTVASMGALAFDMTTLRRCGVTDVWLAMTSPISAETSWDRVIERRIADRLHLRSDVTIMTGYIRIGKNEPETTFDINVTLPLAAWRRATRVKVAAIATEALPLGVIDFDIARLTVDSVCLLFKLEDVFPLNIDREAEAAYVEAVEALNSRDFTEAARLLNQRLAHQESESMPDLRAVTNTLSLLGMAYCGAGEFEKALGVYKRALHERRSIYDDDNPRLLESIYNSGYAYQQVGDYEQANFYYHRALTACRKHLDPGHALITKCIYQLGRVSYDQGRYEESEKFYRDAMAIAEEYPAQQVGLLTVYRNGLAFTLLERGSLDEATAIFEDLLRYVEEKVGTENLDYAKCAADLAESYLRAERYTDARPLLEKAVTIYESEPDFAKLAQIEDLRRSLAACRSRVGP